MLNLNLNLKAQIKWEVINDSITLNPNSLVLDGDIDLNVNGIKTTITPDRKQFIVTFSEKTVDLNSNGNTFRLPKSNIESIFVEKYNNFQKDQIFTKDFMDSLIFYYRRKIYKDLDLNVVSFSSSKKIKFDIDSTKNLYLKNQKISKGKICNVGFDNIIILKEDGDLDIFRDGDFNFLQINSYKIFNCKQLYDLVFKDYVVTLNQKIKKWEQNIQSANLDSIIVLFGMIDNIQVISSERRMITWKKEKTVYNFNQYSSSSKTIMDFSSYESTFNSSSNSLIIGSPIFLYGNNFRNSEMSILGNSTSIISQKTYQEGSVYKKDEGFSISIFVDNNNKTLKVFHKNIFSLSKYSDPFRFVNY